MRGAERVLVGLALAGLALATPAAAEPPAAPPADTAIDFGVVVGQESYRTRGPLVLPERSWQLEMQGRTGAGGPDVHGSAEGTGRVLDLDVPGLVGDSDGSRRPGRSRR